MRAQFFVLQVVRSFAHQVQIEIGEQGGEGVGVKPFHGAAIFLERTQPIGIRGNRIAESTGGHGQQGLEEAVFVDAHSGDLALARSPKHGDGFGAGLESANGQGSYAVHGDRVRPQDYEGIGMAGVNDAIDVGRGNRRSADRCVRR